MTYGFGLIAYKNTLFILFVAFSMFSIIIYPLVETYQSGSAWKETDSKYGYTTLGNLGYNSVQCKNIQLNMAK